jgi:hypothetical protein
MALDVDYDGFGFLQTKLALALAFGEWNVAE